MARVVSPLSLEVEIKYAVWHSDQNQQIMAKSRLEFRMHRNLNEKR